MQTPRQTVSLSKLYATLDPSGSLRMDGTFDWLSPNLLPPRNRQREPVSPPLAMMAHQRGSAVDPDEVVSTATVRDDAQGQILLRVDSITKQYTDLVVLANVGFDVHAGEIVGIIGPNGAGKTTLLEALAGILPAETNDVFWHGGSIPPSRRRETIFYLPDGVRPYQDQPVIRVLSFFASVYRISADEVAVIIESVGLKPVLHKRVHSLSKGYGRRLMLALGLLTPQPLLLMDEPFDGFDLRQVREMVGVLRDQTAKGRTLVLAIHQLMDAERICDRFILLADGRVRGVGTLNDLRARTGNPIGNLEDVFLALT